MAPRQPKTFWIGCTEAANGKPNVHPETMRRWCQQRRVSARLTPGGNWRVEVTEEGWPIELDDDGRRIPPAPVDE